LLKNDSATPLFLFRLSSFPNAQALSANHPSLPSGDRIIVVVQKQRNFGEGAGPGGAGAAQATNKVRRGDIRHAIVVRTVKKLQRKDGHVVRFDDNACVLINKTGEPIGTRLTSRFLPVLWSLSMGVGRVWAGDVDMEVDMEVDGAGGSRRVLCMGRQ